MRLSTDDHTIINTPSPSQIAEVLLLPTCDVATLDSLNPHRGFLSVGLWDDIESVPHFELDHITQTMHRSTTQPLSLPQIIQVLQAFSTHSEDWHQGLEWNILKQTTEDPMLRIAGFDKRLGAAFSFDAEDLRANRNHTLSNPQTKFIDNLQYHIHKPIRVKLVLALIAVTWCAFFLVQGTITVFTAEDVLEKLIHNLRGVTGLTVVLTVIFLGSVFLSRAKFSKGEPRIIRQVEGRAVVKKTLDTGGPSTYFFKIQGVRFGNFYKEEVAVLDPYTYYRAYYIEYGVRFLLSIEAI